MTVAHLTDAALEREVCRRSFREFLAFVRLLEPPTPGDVHSGGAIPFQRWPHLLAMADLLLSARLVAILKARQVGVTWLTAAYLAWLAIYRPGQDWLLLSRTELDAADFLGRAATVLRLLPDYLSVQVSKASSLSLELANGSRLTAMASTEDAGRGHTYSGVAQDEADYHPYLSQNYAAIKPTIDAGGQLIMVSTVNKRRLDTMFKGVIRGAPDNGWRKMFIGWESRPGRTQDWYELTRASVPAASGMTPDLYMEQEYPRCFSPDTLISTDEGILPISQSGHAFISGYEVVYKLRTRSGRELLLTKQHPLAAPDGDGFLYREAQQFSPGDEMLLMRPIFAQRRATITIPGKFKGEAHSLMVDEQWGRFLGFFVSDGYISGIVNGSRSISQTVSVVCDAKDTDIAELVQHDMEELLGQEAHKRTVSTGGAVEIRSCSNRFLSLFQAFGVVKSVGADRGARRKVCVPPSIFKSPRPVVRQFLAAVWECDGFVQKGKPRMVLCSKHEEFLRGIQFLLLGFGITSRIRVADKVATDNGKTHTYVQRELVLRKPEVEAFGKEIGFLSQRKRGRFATFSTKTTGSAIAKPIRYVDEFKSMEPEGYSQVWDATISPEHCFSAQGLWAHNSEQEALAPSRAAAFFDTDALVRMLEFTAEPMSTESGGVIRIWKPRAVGMRYVAGGDCAWGEKSAYSCLPIAEYATGLQVAEVYGRLALDELAFLNVELCKRYNDAWAGVEANGEGRHVVNMMIKLGYGHRMHHRKDDWRENEKSRGMLTDASTRPVMLQSLAEAVSKGHIMPRCKDAIGEMMSFIRNEAGRPEATPGAYSDHVMAWNALWTARESARFGSSSGGQGVDIPMGL